MAKVSGFVLGNRSIKTPDRLLVLFLKRIPPSCLRPWSLLSQMQRLKIDARPARSKAMAALVIGGVAILVWLIVIIVYAATSG